MKGFFPGWWLRLLQRCADECSPRYERYWKWSWVTMFWISPIERWSWRRDNDRILITQCLLNHDLSSRATIVKPTIGAISRTSLYIVIEDTTPGMREDGSLASSMLSWASSLSLGRGQRRLLHQSHVKRGCAPVLRAGWPQVHNAPPFFPSSIFVHYKVSKLLFGLGGGVLLLSIRHWRNFGALESLDLALILLLLVGKLEDFKNFAIML